MLACWLADMQILSAGEDFRRQVNQSNIVQRTPIDAGR
jgi:hypothetical protein